LIFVTLQKGKNFVKFIQRLSLKALSIVIFIVSLKYVEEIRFSKISLNITVALFAYEKKY
jgi:hypothetical protein